MTASSVRPIMPPLTVASSPDLESDIRAAMRNADRNHDLDIKRMQTVGHLRRTARDIAGNLYGTSTETAEVVALQNAFEKALSAFCEAMRNPTNAASYVAPDAARAQQTSQSLAALAEAPLAETKVGANKTDEPLFSDT